MAKRISNAQPDARTSERRGKLTVDPTAVEKEKTKTTSASAGIQAQSANQI